MYHLYKEMICMYVRFFHPFICMKKRYVPLYKETVHMYVPTVSSYKPASSYKPEITVNQAQSL